MGQLHTVNGRNFINGQVGLQKEEALLVGLSFVCIVGKCVGGKQFFGGY